MNASLQQEAKRRQRVLSAQLVRATPFYGYHPGERLFIKIVMCARPGRGGLDAAGAEPGNLTSWAGAQAEPLRREDRFAADAGAPRSCAFAGGRTAGWRGGAGSRLRRTSPSCCS